MTSHSKNLLLVIGCFFVLIAILMGTCNRRKGSGPSLGRKDKMGRKLDDRWKKENKALDEYEQEAIQEFSTVLDQNFAKIEAEIEEAKKKLTDLKGLCQLTYHMALDDVQGNESTENYINNVLKNELNPVLSWKFCK